ncbi:3-(cis-5,6-dihydroxycyclohexa-1,3-dien-1-yl)propanoate dehydrogenase [Alteribacillus bidgolensis]|uniref:NAD(P)-dependent dehydrogenase, short-chain alcohol dehydrogenase family n=1 Tax=Alteribacillus bidgolensis TaxID=930129 RepID=A0A1G8FQQ0_9BACI|nr:3-(cis-5,6-dihydroxycyclohexa-1,3-dien-1-yl)propanoate dehydrogenase [Alteribacillus bidgolensis]SDH84488.1 NAD(P)-dependent dehydrogenase, short-chain alcohol dehydrogenase family [Alteribacillus bidgolensis]
MAEALQGKVAIVTGGTNGIGEAVTKRFIEEGANVCILGRSKPKLESLQEEFRENLLALQGDVSEYESHEEAVRKTVEKYGKLDIFVSNAGVFDGFVSLEQLPEDKMDEAFSTIFDINVKGGLLGAKAAYKELRKTKGNIIFTTSNAGFYPNGGGPIYTASKHAIVGLIRELAYELAPEIRVNGVSPGGTITNITAIPCLQDSVNKIDPETRKKFIESRNPLQIAQKSEDHNGAYVLLASDGSKAITGTVIESDGGLGVRGMPQGKL